MGPHRQILRKSLSTDRAREESRCRLIVCDSLSVPFSHIFINPDASCWPHRFAWPHSSRFTRQRDGSLQFPVPVLPAGNRSRGQFLSVPLHQKRRATHRSPHGILSANILSFEEIERIVRVAVNLGIEKIRLTGGEPFSVNNSKSLLKKSRKSMASKTSR